MTPPRTRYWGVLLAGGYGERLWPWSRRACPKPFLTLTGHQTLLQAAYARLTTLIPKDQIVVIGHAEHAALVRRQLPREIHHQLRTLRRLTRLPLAVGFGISRPEHIRGLAREADGIIVGSAIINAITRARGRRDLAARVGASVQPLLAATRR